MVLMFVYLLCLSEDLTDVFNFTLQYKESTKSYDPYLFVLNSEQLKGRLEEEESAVFKLHSYLI